MLKRWGHGFTRNRGGASSCQPPFLSFIPSHLKLLKEVISLGWERYGGQIRIWGVTHFWKTFSWLLGQINAKKCLPNPLFTHAFASSCSWRYMGHSRSRFCGFTSFSPWLRIRFGKCSVVGMLCGCFCY